MIIGNGFIANLVEDLDHDHLVIFASGVSDPEEVRASEFIREEDLLHNTISQFPDHILVYFGTTTPRDSLYAKHKRRMEEMIQKNAKAWLIIRIGPVININGTGNTFYDFVVRRVKAGEEFKLWKDESRPLLSPNQLHNFLDHWLKSTFLNCVVSFEGRWVPVEEIVYKVEQQLDKKAIYKVI